MKYKNTRVPNLDSNSRVRMPKILIEILQGDKKLIALILMTLITTTK